MKKIKNFLMVLTIILITGIVFYEIPTIADWGDYESYDSSSSYDDWGSSSSDWGSSSSSWDDDSYSGSSSRYRSSSGSSSDAPPIVVFGTIGFFILVYLLIKYNEKKNNGFNSSTMSSRPTQDILARRERNRNELFGKDDKVIEDKIQIDDKMFNKAEFLSWVNDMFVKLQYAWSDRNLESVRYFLTPELFEQTNNQIQRYINDKRVNKLERVSVNISKLYSYEKQGDRDILKVILESKMIDYIVDENTGKIIRGNQTSNIVNPYILTFVRKTGVKTPEGGVKPVTMNCPNCGGATTILSSGKCPYCGSIITTRDNNWALSEMKRYNPNA